MAGGFEGRSVGGWRAGVRGLEGMGRVGWWWVWKAGEDRGLFCS